MEVLAGRTIDKKISIDVYQSFDRIVVEVKDNGIGIKHEDLEKIMLPFYTTKEAGKGTGLGLSITFGIIKEMKGEITFQSEPENGTTVTIKLQTTPLHSIRSSRKPFREYSLKWRCPSSRFSCTLP